MENDDTWMNPHTIWMLSAERPKDGVSYIIERKRRRPVSGNVAFVEEWRLWQTFETKEERDAELARLRADTSWHVRGRQRRYIGGREIPMRDPSEYIDI